MRAALLSTQPSVLSIMIFGSWTLGDEIGRGPHGTVYRATDPDGRAAAVKVLHHPAARDPAFQKKFPAELLALRRLSHPTIARIFDAGVTAGSCWYASELVDGSDLAQNEHVTVEVPVGVAVAGVMVPTDALVYGQNQTWAYVQREPGKFERVAIDPAKAMTGGYFLPQAGGVQAGQAIVVQGAGLLLARELNPSTEAGD